MESGRAQGIGRKKGSKMKRRRGTKKIGEEEEKGKEKGMGGIGERGIREHGKETGREEDRGAREA